MTITCTHPGERCENERYCDEPGCNYGLIMSGFVIDDRYFCYRHFHLTDQEFNEFEDTCYFTDWEPEDNCGECDPDCECMKEAKAICGNTNRKTWEENQNPRWNNEYRVIVPVFLKDEAAVYAINAVGWKHAQGLFATNTGMDCVTGYWQISGPPNDEYYKHEFHKMIMLDIGLNI